MDTVNVLALERILKLPIYGYLNILSSKKFIDYFYASLNKFQTFSHWWSKKLVPCPGRVLRVSIVPQSHYISRLSHHACQKRNLSLVEESIWGAKVAIRLRGHTQRSNAMSAVLAGALRIQTSEKLVKERWLRARKRSLRHGRSCCGL